MPRPLILTAASSALLLAACAGEANEPPPAAAASEIDLTLTPIAEGLEFPWGMAFLPDGDLLVTERDGRLRILRTGTLDPTPITGTPTDTYVDRQGGYLDVALHPGFAENRLIYLSYSRGTEEANTTAVVRGRLNEDATALEGLEDVFVADMPEKRGGLHFGSRLAFLNDGSLLITLGDGFRWMAESQSPANHFGTIVRVNDTGEPLPDNPFAGGEGGDAAVYSYGHRNVQGLAYDPARDIIYAHEHGPKGGDELNIIEAGTNYGWPEITYGVNYDGTIITTETEREGLAQPVVHWVPSIAPSGMVLYAGELYPGWQGDLFIGAMNGPDGQKLVRIDLDEAGAFVGVEDLLTEEGLAYRDVEQGPDGALYLATADLDGVIYRLDIAPGEES